MSESNGVIRIGRKGLKKFAFGEETEGEEGKPFEIDVVAAFQAWVAIDETFRLDGPDVSEEERYSIRTEDAAAYHAAAIAFVKSLGGNKVPNISVGEALDFVARLREQYDELVVFFRPKLREKPASPDISEAELRFSAEAP